MRIALISDIHANFEALSSLTHLLMEVDKVVCLGDYVGYYCQVNEVLDFIRTLNALCVLGNHDSFLLNGCPDFEPDAVRFGIEYADRVIEPGHRQWLATLPLAWGGMVDGRSLLLFHGSPWGPLSDYLYADNPALPRLDEFDYDVIAFGQTHRAFQRLGRRPYLLNPGSVGQSRDVKACACLLLLDTAALTVEKIEYPYGASTVIDLAVRNGAQAWVSKHLV